MVAGSQDNYAGMASRTGPVSLAPNEQVWTSRGWLEHCPDALERPRSAHSLSFCSHLTRNDDIHRLRSNEG